jgi:hypothetical protein
LFREFLLADMFFDAAYFFMRGPFVMGGKKEISFKNKVLTVLALAAGTAVIGAILFLHAVIIRSIM